MSPTQRALKFCKDQGYTAAIKLCRKCDLEKPVEDFYVHRGKKTGRQSWCRACHLVAKLKWARENPEKIRLARRLDAKRKKERRLVKMYGMTNSDVEAMLSSQGGACAICRGIASPRRPGESPWRVDHCHVTGAVRGILCDLCNVGLGSFRDNPTFLRSAVRYLEEGNHVTHAKGA